MSRLSSCNPVILSQDAYPTPLLYFSLTIIRPSPAAMVVVIMEVYNEDKKLSGVQAEIVV